MHEVDYTRHDVRLKKLEMTQDIVRTVIDRNTVATGDVPQLIRDVHAAVAALDEPRELPMPGVEYEPAVTVKKSLASKEHIISLIDGKPYKMLRRHLATHGLTPDEYRARFSLPADYPMTAPAYAEKRRSLAIKHGLGKKGA